MFPELGPESLCRRVSERSPVFVPRVGTGWQGGRVDLALLNLFEEPSFSKEKTHF